MSYDEILEKAVKEAQEIASRDGLELGTTITHPDEQRVFELKEIRGDKAIGVIPAEISENGIEVLREFPLNEIFDPNVAKKLAINELTNQRLPKETVFH